MSALATLHGRWIYGRRVRVLRDRLAAAIPAGPARVLDVGCGDGLIDSLIVEARPELAIEGIDVLVRPGAHIPVARFDGFRIPHPDASFDVVMFVDVLHHTSDPAVLLAEARRVARRCVVVKDHVVAGPLAAERLRVMDWIGNARHGVALPYNYWPERRWREAFAALGLTPASWQRELGLYPAGLDWVFGAGLHCLVRLDRSGAVDARHADATRATNATASG